MQYKPTRSLCATVAIAATLALGSTPAFAQETAPAVSVPPAAPAPVMAAPVAAAPAVAVPPVTVQPTAPEPATAVAEPAPARAETRAEPAARPAVRRAAVTPAPAVPAAVAPVESAPAVPPSVPAESAIQTPLDAAAPAPVAEAPAPTAEVESGGLTGEEAGFLALLAAIGMGGIALLVMGKRRRRAASDIAVSEEAYEGAYEPAPPTALRSPVVMTETPVRANPVYDLSDHPQPAMTEPRGAPAKALAMAPGPISTGDDHSTGDNPEDLIDRMVAAEPDEANPFTSRKARRRRARLILQARENGEADNTAKPFDWRSYEPSRRRAPSELTPA